MKEIRDIEWLVNWAFQAQRVESAMRNLTPSGPGVSHDAMLQMLELGCRVDTSSPAEKWGSAVCHDDAVTVFETVLALPPEARGLVVLHGRAGTRPDWCPEGVGGMEPVLTAKGKPRRIYRDPVRCRGDLGPMMHWVGMRPEQVEFHRAQYDVWRQGLSALVTPLNKNLTDFEARAPLVAARPWDWGEGGMPGRTIHRVIEGA